MGKKTIKRQNKKGKRMQKRFGGDSPIAPYSFNGGGFYKPAPPIPGPFVGQSWGSSVSKWPGVDGVSDNRNYYTLNEYYQDPKMMIVGGKKKKQTRKKRTFRSNTRKNKKKGGSTIVPQDLINFGRNIGYSINSTYNTLRGVDAPTNPLPYKDQL
jgi:hypothetical protein